jgi:hypothetical protein
MRNLNRLAFLIVTLLLCQNTQAQFREGEMIASAGYGLASQLEGSTLVVPPISLMLEYSHDDAIIIGGYIGYTSTSGESAIFDISWQDNVFILGLRGSYNVELTKNFDVYVGGIAGYRIATTVITEGSIPFFGRPTGVNVNGTAIAGFAGARYLINNKFGFFGEVGYGITLVNMGLVANIGRNKLY